MTYSYEQFKKEALDLNLKSLNLNNFKFDLICPKSNNNNDNNENDLLVFIYF